jgi:adenosylmethionine-8-amino-7-oxononanoate aminotransferase
MPTCGNIDGTNGDIIILSPAYNITKEDVETIVDRLERVIRQVLG